MGQYYTPLLISDNGKISCLYSHDYNNGLKLMEHSYIGNDFVNAVFTQIWHNPQRVAWIGGYSNSKDGDPWESIVPENFMDYYHVAWGEERTPIAHVPRGLVTMKNTRRFLINHDKKEYIALAEYVEQNKWHKEGEYRKYTDKKWTKFKMVHYSYDMCVNPLPLLTACGNGRGGGDYYSSHPDYDKVGIWAFDHIELTGKDPAKHLSGYKKVSFAFKEVGG